MEPEITKAERDHLTLLHAAARDPMATARERSMAQVQLTDQLVWTGRTDYTNGDLPVLLRALDVAEAEQKRLRRVLLLLDRITDGKDESNGTDPEAIQIVVERFVALKAENSALKAKLDSANGSLDALRNAINDYDGADRGREVKIPVGRAIGIMADLRADKHSLEAKLAAAEAERDRMRNEADGYQRLAKESQESQDKSALLVIGPVNDEFRVYGPTPNSEERFAKTFADYWKLINEVARGMSLEEENAALKAKLAALVDYLRNVMATASKAIPSTADEAIGDAERVLFCQQLLSHESLAAAKEPKP